MKHAGPVLAPFAKFDLAPEMMGHELHPVADAEDRNSERKNLWIRMRCAFVVNARRSPRKDNAFRRQGCDFPGRDIELDDLRIDLAFPDTPGDDLGVLRSEIEDQDFRMLRGRRFHHG